MSFSSVKILGHFQSITNELYTDFQQQEFKNKEEWKQFLHLTMPEAKRPHRVDFKTSKVIVLKTVTGQENWIGLINSQMVSKKTLELQVDNLSFRRYAFETSTCCASYLFLVVDQTRRVKIQQVNSKILLEKFLKKTDEITTSSIKVYECLKELRALGLEENQVQRKRDIRALPLSNKQKAICRNYLDANLDITKLLNEVAIEESKLRLQLCGPALEKLS